MHSLGLSYHSWRAGPLFCYTFEVDTFATLFAGRFEQKGDDNVVRRDQAQLETIHVRRTRGFEVGDIDEREIHLAFGGIDAAGFQSWLILRAAEMSDPQIVAIQVIHAGHGRSAGLAAEILDYRRPIAAGRVGDMHRAGVRARPAPFHRAVPFAHQRAEFVESRRAVLRDRSRT